MYNSPIGNNINGGISYIPPTPIGNVMNIAGQGYNNMGYYNNVYNNHFNPYLMKQQQELEAARQREEQSQQSNMWKTLSRNCNTIMGNTEDLEDHLKRYDPVTITEQINEEANYNRLVNLQINGIYNNPHHMEAIRRQNLIADQSKQRFPEGTNLATFLDGAGELYAEMMDRKIKESNKNVGRLYNSDHYKQLISIHNRDVNGFKNTNIDDLEVSLPEHIRGNFSDRKKQFFEAIFANK